MEMEDFRKDVLEATFARASSDLQFIECAFYEVCTDFLVEFEEVTNPEWAPYRGKWTKGRQIRVDGYSVNENDGILTLFIVDFRRTPNAESLTQTEIDADFGKVIAFAEAALSGELHPKLEQSSPGFDVAEMIASWSGRISRIQFYLLSDCLLSNRVRDYEGPQVNGLNTEYRIWDISRFFRVAGSSRGKEEIEIDFLNIRAHGIPCLPAHLDSSPYQSFLCVIPGDVLADIYERYGERLLEQNVRMFLQARGNVNKGIRSTLLSESDMFFAYNNGITTTATHITTRESGRGGLELISARDLQIVNGGQTTASIFWSRKRDNVDLSKVFVQMKLSVIDADVADGVVPKISQYANSQNRVNAADFFANHPFHLRIEQFSRRLWAPATGGAQHETHWFYERARGQYLNAQAALTPAKQKQFLLQNPRSQMFSKTDLAKYENCWSMLPHIVSQGAQKNFAQFARAISERWDKGDTEFNEAYYRELVCRAILFRSVERIVSKQPWYDGGYRANIVAYTMARFALEIAEKGYEMNWRKLWERQSLSDVVEGYLADASKNVADILLAPEQGRANVSEWAKVELCWQRVRHVKLPNITKLVDELVAPEAVVHEKKTATYVQQIDNGIQAQTHVLELGNAFWGTLLKWNESSKELTPTECEVVAFASKRGKIPSEKQATWLIAIKAKAEASGFKVKQ